MFLAAQWVGHPTVAVAVAARDLMERELEEGLVRVALDSRVQAAPKYSLR